MHVPELPNYRVGKNLILVHCSVESSNLRLARQFFRGFFSRVSVIPVLPCSSSVVVTRSPCKMVQPTSFSPKRLTQTIAAQGCPRWRNGCTGKEERMRGREEGGMTAEGTTSYTIRPSSQKLITSVEYGSSCQALMRKPVEWQPLLQSLSYLDSPHHQASTGEERPANLVEGEGARP